MFEELFIPGYETVRVYDEVPSTMDLARALSELPGSSLVVARQQSAGRGRQGRQWSSSRSAFMGTFVFRTDHPTATLSGYSLAVGVAIAEEIAGLGGNLTLKWPNDLVVVSEGELRKVGGILIEVEEHLMYRSVLVGLGLNLSDAPEDVPTASSLRQAFGIRRSVAEVISPLAVSLLDMHQRFCAQGGFESFRQRWLERSCLVVGRSSVRIDLGRGIVTGVFQGVDSTGALVLTSDEGTRVLHSGHVLEVRL